MSKIEITGCDITACGIPMEFDQLEYELNGEIKYKMAEPWCEGRTFATVTLVLSQEGLWKWEVDAYARGESLYFYGSFSNEKYDNADECMCHAAHEYEEVLRDLTGWANSFQEYCPPRFGREEYEKPVVWSQE